MDLKHITESPFREGSKGDIFFKACNLDPDNGFSDIIGLKQLTELGLRTDNGGSWCRSDGPIGKYFEINRAKKHGRIDSVQLVGYKKNYFSGRIAPEIAEYYKGRRCVVLALRTKRGEVDHKDGRKDDPNLHENQGLPDFQPMHKTPNIAKRNHCKDCKDTGIRFDATRLGYSKSQYIGTPEYHGSCIGCYWYDPKVFNIKISDCFKKDR